MLLKRTVATAAAAIGFVAVLNSSASAQAKYPDRPVTMIVAFDAGGPTDIPARLIAEKMGDILGQRVIVVNRPGAGGIIGNQFVQNSKPDGYTLLFGTSGPMTIGPAVSSKTPYDPVNDFEMVAITTINSPIFALTNTQTGVKDLKSFVEKAKASQAKFKFSSPGTGGTNSASGLAFADIFKTPLVEVPYKGNAPAINALASGEVEFTFAGYGSIQSQLDKLVPLAVLSDKRSKTLPNVPTISEAGFGDLMTLTSWRVWQGVWAPKGTPKDILDALNKAVNRATSDPDLLKRFDALDLEARTDTTPESAKAALAKEVAEWKIIAERLKLKID